MDPEKTLLHVCLTSLINWQRKSVEIRSLRCFFCWPNNTQMCLIKPQILWNVIIDL